MKAMLLISGGIDSPVAGHMMLKRGLELAAVHFSNQPFVDDKPLSKVKRLLQRLANLHKVSIPFYLVNHGNNHASFMQNKTDRKFHCVLCRRMMLRIAEKIALENDCTFLLTGENLGQVASQTLDNLTICSSVIKMESLRPLLSFDKNDIIVIAREIETYDTSTEPSMCCNLTPPNPATKANKWILERQEEKLPIDELITQGLASVEKSMIVPSKT